MNGAGMEEDGFDLDRIKDEILEAMLPNVIFDGWTNQSLRDAVALTGHDGGTAQLAFPGGIPQIVEHFSGWADRRMLEELDRHDLAAMKVRDRITLAVRARLEILAPHEEAVRRALTFLALPQNAGLGGRIVYRTVDAMWYAAGDTSTDHNYYTKRALLAAVLTSTTLYWLNDQSDGKAETWAFLDRRIADVMRVGRTTGKVSGIGNMLANLPSPFRFARNVRRRASGY
ncbi:COQ9 family protein [Skermanella mucosa]|uniref:COQ9 family protein n=1 Tax=Skermanella mucosa TaxID=1789672 RepID=UPI001E4C0DC0|nr:COQ9 family protein [Skermanella mucosa]UEM22244.1 COQ9 family protein [Skermanella mucosa]